MSKHTGGPAFPGKTKKYMEGDDGFATGMTLRDYFAAQALPSLMSHYIGTGSKSEVLARHAYQVADAMLAERLN